MRILGSMKKLALLLIVVSACFLPGCGPETTEPNYQMVPQETKDWCVFQIGTWWVYEEETLKTRNSVYVFFTQDTLFSYINNDKNIYLNFQEINTGMASTLGVDTTSFSIAGIATGIVLSTKRCIRREAFH